MMGIVDEKEQEGENRGGMTESDKEVMGGTVEVEREEIEDCEDVWELDSLGSGKTRAGGSEFEFLKNVEVDEREEELDKRVGEGREKGGREDGEEKIEWVARVGKG